MIRVEFRVSKPQATRSPPTQTQSGIHPAECGYPRTQLQGGEVTTHAQCHAGPRARGSDASDAHRLLVPASGRGRPQRFTSKKLKAF